MIKIKVGNVSIEITTDEEAEEEVSEIPFGFSVVSDTQVSGE